MHVDCSTNWIIPAACVSGMLLSAQGYLSRAQECELQQNGMRLTLRVFFIMAQLYIRAVTEWFIRSDVIALSPMGPQLLPNSDLYPCMQDLKSGTAVSAVLPVSDSHRCSSCQGSRSVTYNPPSTHTHPSSAHSMPITGLYKCQRSLRIDSLQ